MQNYVKKVDFGQSYTEFAVVMAMSKIMDTQSTYENFAKDD